MLITIPRRAISFHGRSKVKNILRLDIYIRWQKTRVDAKVKYASSSRGISISFLNAYIIFQQILVQCVKLFIIQLYVK
jgi:hypothetical protein